MDDYTEFAEKPQGVTAALQTLVNLSCDLEREMEEDVAALARKQEQLRGILWKDIPDEMKRIGLKQCVTPDGLTVEIKNEVDSHISKEHQFAAHAWMESNGHAGLLKREISISFSKEQSEAAAKLFEDLQKDYPAVMEQKVHPSTLKAWVKEMLNEGRDIPEDLFGIFQRDVAKVKQGKG